MTMNITATEAREAIEKLEEYISSRQGKIKVAIKDMEKATKKNDFLKIQSLNNMITLYFKGIKETEEQIEQFKYELKIAEAMENECEGWNLVIDYLEELFDGDMEWFKALKALNYEQRSKESKATQKVAQMTEEEAKKLFRNDITIRFHKLVNSAKKIVGEHVSEVNLARNENSGLDGIVTGEQGSASLNTIIAGGYNIQRAHYRTLVKKA